MARRKQFEEGDLEFGPPVPQNILDQMADRARALQSKPAQFNVPEALQEQALLRQERLAPKVTTPPEVFGPPAPELAKKAAVKQLKSKAKDAGIKLDEKAVEKGLSQVRGAQVLAQQGIDPIKSSVLERLKADPSLSDKEKVLAPGEEQTQSVLATILTGLLPTLIGGAVGGFRGGEIGAAIGGRGVAQIVTREEEEQKRQRELAQKAVEKKEARKEKLEDFILSQEALLEKEQREELRDKDKRKELAELEQAKIRLQSGLESERRKAELFIKSKSDQDLERLKKDLELRNKRIELESKAATDKGAKKLTSEEKKAVQNIVFSLRGIQGMKKAYQAGQKTFTISGDNDFTFYQNMFVEGLSRPQTGAALTAQETKNFKGFSPKALDSRDVGLSKLNQVDQLLRERLQFLGVDINEFNSLKEPIELKTKLGLLDQVFGKGKGKVDQETRATGILGQELGQTDDMEMVNRNASLLVEAESQRGKRLTLDEAKAIIRKRMGK